MIFFKRKRIIAEQECRIEHLEEKLRERDRHIISLGDRYQFLVDSGRDFTKQVGLRVGMNPGTNNGDLFIRLDALQRNTVLLNIVKEILGGVDWSMETNPTQEEIVTASMAALEVLK